MYAAVRGCKAFSVTKISMKEDVKMNQKKIFCVIICFVFMSLFCVLPVYADYDDYDLGDYNYTPVAVPDPSQYPCNAEGFTSFNRDLSLYLAVSPYDAVCDYISDYSLPSNVMEYFSMSDDDIKNPFEVFRRMMFPTSAFSPFYDPYYEDEWHSHGHPGSNGRETYTWGNGLLTFTYDFNLMGNITLAAQSSVDPKNTYSKDYYDVLCSVVYTASFSYGGNSVFWRTSDGIHYNASQNKNFHYSGKISNPTVSIYEDYSNHYMAQIYCDGIINCYNTDTGETTTNSFKKSSIGNGLVLCNKSDPNATEIVNTLKGVPMLYKDPDTPSQIDNAPQCILLPEPKNDITDPPVTAPTTPFFYYVSPDGTINISPDIVLTDPNTPFTAPDSSFPVSSDGTVNFGGNTFMCIPVLNTFNLNMQNNFNVSLSAFYQNLFLNMGGDPAACGCPDYTSWLSLINSRLAGVDYDLQRIYHVLLAIYNKQAKQFDFSVNGLPGVEFPEIDGEVTVAIDDLELEMYRKFDYSAYFNCLRLILDYFVDGYVEIDTTNYDKLFLVDDPPNPLPLPDTSEDPPVDETLPDAAAASVSYSTFQNFYRTGTASPSFTFDFMGHSIDLMSWYSPEVEPYMAVLRNFLGLCILCGWLMWFVRVLPSLFNVVGSVDNGKDGG